MDKALQIYPAGRGRGHSPYLTLFSSILFQLEMASHTPLFHALYFDTQSVFAPLKIALYICVYICVQVCARVSACGVWKSGITVRSLLTTLHLILCVCRGGGSICGWMFMHTETSGEHQVSRSIPAPTITLLKQNLYWTRS